MTDDLVLSRNHFQIDNKPPLCHLVDLGSTNGTKVNGLRVKQVALREGDVITAGDSAFIVHFMEDSKDTQDFAGCAGCGGRIPIGARASRTTNEIVLIDGQRSIWLCEACQARRLKFPKTATDYLIEEWIGGGGMGEVFRARQLSRNRPVAIKMLSTNSAIGEKASSYFRREIEVLKDLLMPGGKSHHSIVSFYELYEVDSQFQLIMEYVDGKNAHEWLAGLSGPLPIASAAKIGSVLLMQAANFAHQKGYVHRDVKPSNLLIFGPVHRPRVKAHRLPACQEFRRNRRAWKASLTRQAETSAESIGFISPEHIRQFSDIREPADIYSAAATPIFCSTEKYPYLGFDPRHADSYQMIFAASCRPCVRSRPDAPEGLERILLKALQKQPKGPLENRRRAMAAALRLRPNAPLIS